MFNPLTPAEVVTAIGRTARDAARSDEPASEFSRGQLMSAYSASRHLAVELGSFEPELRQFAGAVAAAMRSRAAELDDAGSFQVLASQLDVSSDPHAIGDAICELLSALRRDGRPDAAELRSEVHALLRRLADREVEILADVIEAPRPS